MTILPVKTDAPDGAGPAYQPDEGVLARIESLSSLPPKRQLATLLSGDSTAAPEEVLVHFLRSFHVAGDHAASAKIAHVITERISGKLVRLARVWRLGFPPDLMDDVVDEVLNDLYEQLFSTSSTAQFWEVRFWICFNRRAITIMRKRRGELDQIAADESDDEDEEDAAIETAPTLVRLDDPVTRALLSDALAHLSQPYRTAFVLKHWAGYPEEVADGSDSIASLMGVTGRSVRNYLKHAARELDTWRDEAMNHG